MLIIIILWWLIRSLTNMWLMWILMWKLKLKKTNLQRFSRSIKHNNGIKKINLI